MIRLKKAAVLLLLFFGLVFYMVLFVEYLISVF